MSTHNICFCRELRKILCGYTLLSVAMIESMDILVYVDKQRMSRSDCMNAHAHLDLCCLHIA